METKCQVWHWCLHSGHQFSFLCPNGTVFNQVSHHHELLIIKPKSEFLFKQAVRVCDWFFNVKCEAAEELYSNNEELYKDAQGNPI